MHRCQPHRRRRSRGAKMVSRGRSGRGDRRSAPPCHTFLTFWTAGSRGGVLCAIVAREADDPSSRRIIRQRYGRPGAFVGYRLNKDPWVAYDTSGSDHKGAKNSTCPRLRRRHSYLSPYKINAHCLGIEAGGVRD